MLYKHPSFKYIFPYINKGEWQITALKYPKKPKEIITGVGIFLEDNYGKKILDSILPDSDKEYMNEHGQIKANMTLICDAGNTYQSCGLLSSGLLKQRDELKETLRMVRTIAEIRGLTGIVKDCDETLKNCE